MGRWDLGCKDHRADKSGIHDLPEEAHGNRDGHSSLEAQESPHHHQETITLGTWSPYQ